MSVMMIMLMMVMVMMVVVAVVMIVMVMFMTFVDQRLRRPESVTHNALSVYRNCRQDGLNGRAYDVYGNARVEQGAQRHIAANSGMTVEPGCFHDKLELLRRFY